MTTQISSIDDLLSTQINASTPEISETKGEPREDLDYGQEDEAPQLSGGEYDDAPEEAREPREPETEEQDEKKGITDEYGNPKASNERKYTEEEVNEKINKAVRDRMARLERNAPLAAQQQIQKEVQDNFVADPDSADSWQKQLSEFVKQTVNNMGKEQARAQQMQQEAQAQAQFEEKFHKGMGKFADFVDVVGHHPITDAMVVATREMKDPAAFLYAASQRAPQELERISKIRDPYAQIAAVGALEASLRKTSPATRAPRPMSRTVDDGRLEHRSDKEDSIEDLIKKSENRKLQNMNGMLRRR